MARIGATVVLVLGAATAIAARPQGGSIPAPAPQAPVAPMVPAQTPAAIRQDSAAPSTAQPQPGDTVSAQGAPTLADSAQPSVTQREVPEPMGAWPVDPATGLTLVNGEPVVGRVFVMQKTDGLRAYEGVSRHYVGEPLPPEAPAIGTSYQQPDLSAVRRHRGMMVQSNLWSIETKRSAMETQHYRRMAAPDSAAPNSGIRR